MGDWQERFLAEQHKLGCTDCGRSDAVTAGSAVVERVGAGSVVWPRWPDVGELHIVPHGGTRVPTELLAHVGAGRFDELADLVHRNADTGTGAMARVLAQSATRRSGAAVATFEMSRLLLDANRRGGEQVPTEPYAGEPTLYGPWLAAHGDQLRAECLAPWLDRVNDIASAFAVPVVYHHHTYDTFGLRARDNDVAGTTQRPAFQLFRSQPDPGSTSRGRELAPYDVLLVVRDQMHRHLCDEHGDAGMQGDIDWPLLAVDIPFHSSAGQRHIIYEVRKDLVGTDDAIDRWIRERPWSVAGSGTFRGSCEVTRPRS